MRTVVLPRDVSFFPSYVPSASMTCPHTAVARPRSRPLGLLLCLLLLGGSLPAAAQSVDTVVDDLRAAYQRQLESVDTYIVETTLYTSYNRKVTRDGTPSYETVTRLKGSEGSSVATETTPTMAYGLHFDRLRQHAAYEGVETIDGVRSHALRVDDPERVIPEMGPDAAARMTYYIDAEQHVPVRLLLTPRPSGDGPQPSTVTIDMRDYRTVDGLTLPYRMEFRVDMQLSDQQRQQMEQAMTQMENMPAQQRRMMEKMMGDQMDTMKQMMGGEPIVVEVQRVEVNAEIPEGVF